MKLPLVNPSLAEVMDRHTAPGSLWYAEEDRIRCVACGHRCLLGEGRRGICKVRYNEQGQLRVPFGYIAGLQSDPVEKKPFFHVFPGVDALTFGMLGCDLHCSYCQNWVTSQALRDPAASVPLRPVTPQQLIDIGRREGARLVVSSYNEPLITAEWAVAVFREAAAAGLPCAFVSNGNATPEVLDFLKPWIIAYKVDLKSFDDRHYRTLGGALDNITSTIRMVHERKIWLEVVTLVIPGFNDSAQELRQAAQFLASVSRDIPWHVTAFHKDYRMSDPDATTPEMLIRAAEIGAEEGLRYVYAGNLPGKVGPWEDTHCPGCGETVIRRTGYLVRDYRISSDGGCPRCHTAIPGLWFPRPQEARTGNDFEAYVSRRPRSMASSLPASANRMGAAGPALEGARIAVPEGEPVMTIPAPAVPSSPGSMPALSEAQHQQVLDHTQQLLWASFSGSPVPVPDLPGLTDLPVSGVFVSLKRGKHLRGCCGSLSTTPGPLGQALRHASWRTLREDTRFPPVSPTELPYLNVEVWLLSQPQIVDAVGEERLQAVILGKHGIQVARGSAHALFLPSVPVEGQWDLRRYLDQVCLKAGLAATAWLEPETKLSVFEGQVLRGRVAPNSATEAILPRALPSPEQLAACADFCRQNILALLRGLTPAYYLAAVPDGNVHGVVLTLRWGPSGEVRTFSQISLRPQIPLQATLFSLTQAAAEAIAARKVLGEIQVGISIMHDPNLHGTLADPDLDGFDPQQRGILVMERSRLGLAFHPQHQARQLLDTAAQQAQVRQPAGTSVYSLLTVSTVAPVAASTVPRAVRGGAERSPAAAGRFYPARPDELAAMVDKLLAGERQPERWSAALVPHAGLKFSGRIAAAVLQRLELPRTIIVLGPKHTPLGVEWAVAPHQTWLFPGGSVPGDFQLARQLSQAIPGLELDAAAHQQEHAIEVELPLLARLAPAARVVGIVIGHGDLESCRRFAEGLANVIRERKDKPLLLISSDMNHFATEAVNRRLDMLALDALERLDPADLYQTVTGNRISMCGIMPAVTVMETLRLLGGLKKAERVAYTTSAEVSGDPSRVVGYAGVLLD